MRPTRRLALAAAALLAGAAPAADARSAPRADWSSMVTPAPGPPEVFGGAGPACVQGARALPSDGVGYEAVRLSRNRHWGHPALIAYVQALGRRLQAAGFPIVYIGDMSQPRGGPLPYGHASHQSGLDVDVWLDLSPKPPRLPAAREVLDLPSFVLRDQTAVDRSRWTPRHAELVRLAASPPEVDRILVNWTIKRELCDTVAGDRAWLRKLRPWWGHDDHLHVRLACPASSPGCTPQAPIPPGDGCDSSLDWWYERTRPSLVPLPPPKPKPRPPLPAACAAVLRAP